MASETYYFVFNIIFVICAAFGILNLLLLRKGRTVFGVTLKPGTPEYRRGITLASFRNIAIVGLLVVISISSLIYLTKRLMDSGDYSFGLLLFLAGFVVLISAIIFPFIRKQAKEIYKLGSSRKK